MPCEGPAIESAVSFGNNSRSRATMRSAWLLGRKQLPGGVALAWPGRGGADARTRERGYPQAAGGENRWVVFH